MLASRCSLAGTRFISVHGRSRPVERAMAIFTLEPTPFLSVKMCEVRAKRAEARAPACGGRGAAVCAATEGAICACRFAFVRPCTSKNIVTRVSQDFELQGHNARSTFQNPTLFHCGKTACMVVHRLASREHVLASSVESSQHDDVYEPLLGVGGFSLAQRCLKVLNSKGFAPPHE